MTVDVGSKLKARRIQKGLTQQELADKTGVSESYVCQIENGKMVSLKKLEKLAHALDCQPRDLL